MQQLMQYGRWAVAMTIVMAGALAPGMSAMAADPPAKPAAAARGVAALGRIESGDYGFCAKCGGEIGEDRLDVVPFTPFCRNCA